MAGRHPAEPTSVDPGSPSREPPLVPHDAVHVIDTIKNEGNDAVSCADYPAALNSYGKAICLAAKALTNGGGRDASAAVEASGVNDHLRSLLAVLLANRSAVFLGIAEGKFHPASGSSVVSAPSPAVLRRK